MYRPLSCHGVDGSCRSASPDELFVFRDVAAPVGAVENMRPPTKGNFPADVRIVQELLNQVPLEQGGQMRAGGGGSLMVDGVSGPRTRNAIRVFQKKRFPEFFPDSVVEHSHRTIYQLNQLVAPAVDPAMQARGRAAFANAASYIRRARIQLDAYRMSLDLPNPLFPNEKLKNMVNYHFHLDRSTNPKRDLLAIDRVLGMMYTVAAHLPAGPDGKPGYGFVETRPLSHHTKPTYAYTFTGGYRFMGKTVTEMGKIYGWDVWKSGGEQRADMLYLTRRVFNAAPGIFDYVIIHELAHFVGGVAGDIDCIYDRAYYDRNRIQYENLNCYQAMTNADSYSEFCWQARNGKMYVPG